MAMCGIEPGSIDVGRDDDGELRSFIEVGDRPEYRALKTKAQIADAHINDGQITDAQIHNEQTDATARLFNPPVSPIPGGDMTSLEPVPRTSTLLTAVHLWRSRARDLVTGSRRKTVMMAVGGSLAVVVIALGINPSGGAPKQPAVNDVTTDTGGGGPTSAAQPDFTDPQTASIEFALTGAIPGLGNMQSVPRSAVHASVASRAGDIVLIDLTVTKPSGLTAFATVLLQKAGSQWRMRQIVDERN